MKRLVLTLSLAALILTPACRKAYPTDNSAMTLYPPAGLAPGATPTPVPCDAVLVDLAGFVPYPQMTPVPSVPDVSPGAPVRGVIRSMADWAEFCRLIGKDPTVFLPPVDLADRMLVYRAMPEPECQSRSSLIGFDCGTAGMTARLHTITYAFIRCITGPLGCAFKAYSVPTSGLPVVWVETEEVLTAVPALPTPFPAP